MKNNSTNSDNSQGDSARRLLTTVLDKLGEITRAASKGSFVFRGEPKYYQEISSSLYREYKELLEPFGVDGFDMRYVQSEVLTEATRYVGDLLPEDLLSQLQHYGHPTNLIDFTTDYLIALYFACSSESSEHGRVILLNADANSLIRMRSPLNRIKAQKSIFVDPPSGVVNADQTIRIPRKLKLPILEYLNSYHDISTQTIYDDIHGFIKNANIHRSAYTEFHVAGLHLNQGNLIEALKHYNRSIELNAYQKATYANRGLTFARMKRYDDAIRDFSQAITLDPQDAQAYQERGQVYFESGHPRLAEKDFSEAVRLDERREGAYIGRAACRVHRGDFDGAMHDMNFAIDLNPENNAAYSGRGAAFAAMGDYQSALHDLGTAIAISPANPDTYMTRAMVHSALGVHQSAIEDFGSYLELGGEDSSAAYFRRGVALLALGFFGKARTDLKTALEQDPCVATRVVARMSTIADGSETLALPDEVPTDLLEILEPLGWR